MLKLYSQARAAIAQVAKALRPGGHLHNTAKGVWCYYRHRASQAEVLRVGYDDIAYRRIVVAWCHHPGCNCIAVRWGKDVGNGNC